MLGSLFLTGFRIPAPSKKGLALGSRFRGFYRLPTPQLQPPSSKLQVPNTGPKKPIEYFVNYIIIKFLGTSKWNIGRKYWKRRKEETVNVEDYENFKFPRFYDKYLYNLSLEYYISFWSRFWEQFLVLR